MNLFRRGELRDAGPRVREILVIKCAHKGIPVPTLASLESSSNRVELESERRNMLGHQLPALPPLDSFWSELPRLFEWLEGRAVVEALVPAPAAADEDPSWSPPPVLST